MPVDDRPRIGVFGAGAIGSVVGGYLSRAGLDVVLVDPWFQHLDQVARKGLTVTAVDEEFVTHPTVAQLDELPGIGMLDVVIIGAKSYDTRWLGILAEPHLRQDGIVLSAQNGMNEAVLLELFGKDRTAGCVVPMAAALPEPAQARRMSAEEWGALVIGQLGGGRSPRLDRLAEVMASLVGVTVSSEIERELWGKLTLNVMSNGLGGLTGFTTRRLWDDGTVLDIAIAMAHEVAVLAARQGVALQPILKTIDHELIASADRLDGEAWAEVKKRMRAVAATRTGDKENKPSLLQDVEKGRRTEIDYINGWVVRAAVEYGLEAPVNAALTAAVRDRDAGVGPAGADALVPLAELVRQRHGG